MLKGIGVYFILLIVVVLLIFLVPVFKRKKAVRIAAEKQRARQEENRRRLEADRREREESEKRWQMEREKKSAKQKKLSGSLPDPRSIVSTNRSLKYLPPGSTLPNLPRFQKSAMLLSILKQPALITARMPLSRSEPSRLKTAVSSQNIIR